MPKHFTLPSIRLQLEAEKRALRILTICHENPELLLELKNKTIKNAERLIQNIDYNKVPGWMKKKIDTLELLIAVESGSDDRLLQFGINPPSFESKCFGIALIEVLSDDIFEYFFNPAAARAEQLGRSLGKLVIIVFVTSIFLGIIYVLF
jgi:hypothetical protein